ncbi:MAG: NAD-binding protein [Bacillota bacterium]
MVIEKSESKARRFQEALDVMVMVDNGANASVLEKADIKNGDMLIAVTQHDEINIIACMLVKKYDVPLTICRIRNSGYVDQTSVLTPKQLGIDLVINPEKVVALEISRMLHFPADSEIEYFNRGKVMMLGVTVGEEAGIAGVPIKIYRCKVRRPLLLGLAITKVSSLSPVGVTLLIQGIKFTCSAAVEH